MKRFIFSSVCILLGLGATAQNEADVLRYSSQYVLGTARFTGLGGAMGALGGDMSATHINPASIGLYRFGDVSFSPTMEFNVIGSEVNGNTFSADNNKLVINNAGFVLANETNDPYWKAINFGVSYNRMNTFNDNLNIRSTMPVQNSLMQDFAKEANGFAVDDLSEFSAGLAYQGYVIDLLDTISNLYDGRAYTGDLTQTQNAERGGRLSETALNFGANYNDKVYIGASLNFQSPYYKSRVETTETPLDVDNTDLVSYTYTESLETSGLGFNFKIGGIVKGGKYLRFGASVQTPTTFTLTDNYRTSLTSTLRDPSETLNSQSSLSVFEYRVRTPWRFMGSVAGIIGKKALVSFQYEFADFSSGSLKNSSSYGSKADFTDSNDAISRLFTSSNVFRAGAEYRITNEFYGRAGFAYFTNPNKGNEFTSADLNRYQYSGGLGYRAASWNIDLTYQLAQFQEIYRTNFSAPHITTLSNDLSSIILTLGFRL